MGACATKPKVLKEGGAPEPVKEEVVVATGGGGEAVDKGVAVGEEEKKGFNVEKDIGDVGGDNRLEAEIVDDSNKRRSLSNLFKENEAEKEPTESGKAPAEPEKLETSESCEKPTESAVAKEEPSTAVKEQSVEKPEEALETSKSISKPSDPAVAKEEPLTVKEQSVEKSEEPIKQEKAVTEEPAVVPLQETLKSETPAEPVPVSGTVNAPVKVETLKSEIPAEPVPVSGTVNAPVKVDTEKVTGEVKPGAAAENTKITETVEEKKPEEAK
ncbi:enolase-phosphatase [Salix suchowensis]|uniref:Uncharacterized protein n=1 Tax=Salix koriyanagi TaxID=2511006 RepID=A0A9Q0X2C4_9ROSI|nr:enolase-phosphatase [Salix suchowensis]KAJ6777168.1 hypothetical protein OIU74_001202 [Salix koriyanagi]